MLIYEVPLTRTCCRNGAQARALRMATSYTRTRSSGSSNRRSSTGPFAGAPLNGPGGLGTTAQW